MLTKRFLLLPIAIVFISALFSSCEEEEKVIAPKISEGVIHFELSYPYYEDAFMASIMPDEMEMTFKNNIGCSANIPGILSNDVKLFSETGGFVLEVGPDNCVAVTKIFSKYGIKVHDIGTTTESDLILMNQLTDLTINEARTAWTNGLREKM